MEDTSQQDVNTQNIYKEKLNVLIAKNRSYFIIGLIGFIFIIYIFILQLGEQVLMQFKKDILSLISFNSEHIDTVKIVDFSQKLTNKSIDYISPTKSKAQIQNRIEINGQISAIASDQVTYTKNKYIVEKGDSLALIAQKVYGDRDAWLRIAKANDLSSPDLIEVGMELVIPR